MTRTPAVAGSFYPSDPAALEAELRRLIPPSPDPRKRVVGAVSPHAGYVYSGAVAGELFSRIHIPRTVLILGPNHTGLGSPAALYGQGEWLTPLGTVPVEERLAALVLRHVSFASADTVAHLREHSLEVQVPFLRHLRPDVSIVPLCLGFGEWEVCRKLGEGLAEAVRDFGEEVLILASSDMTHFEPAREARRKDDEALERVLALDPEGLLAVCRRRRITMCGVVPTAVMLTAALALEATSAELVRYATSGDVSGDFDSVVGYAAVEVW